MLLEDAVVRSRGPVEQPEHFGDVGAGDHGALAVRARTHELVPQFKEHGGIEESEAHGIEKRRRIVVAEIRLPAEGDAELVVNEEIEIEV